MLIPSSSLGSLHGTYLPTTWPSIDSRQMGLGTSRPEQKDDTLDVSSSGFPLHKTLGFKEVDRSLAARARTSIVRVSQSVQLKELRV
jgi:hypothetical protein